jgi:hypothetical protein
MLGIPQAITQVRPYLRFRIGIDLATIIDAVGTD